MTISRTTIIPQLKRLFFSSLPRLLPLSSPSDSLIPFSFSFSLSLRSIRTCTELPLKLARGRESVRSSLVVLRVRGLRGCSSTVGRVIVLVRPRFGWTGVTVFVLHGAPGSRGVLDLCLAGVGASDTDSDWPSAVGEGTWDWCRLDFGRGLLRAWVVEEVLERGLDVGFAEALDAGLRVAVTDLGDESSIDLAFALFCFLIIMLVLASSLETDTLRLRFRPLHPIAAHDASLSSWIVESARNRARLISVVCLPS